jgi:DNA-binding LacI/PurR family transcriptional regulator
VGVGPHLADRLLERLQNERVPVATVEDKFRGHEEQVVRSDEASGLGAAVEHLVALGHRRFGYLAAGPDEQVSERRIATLQALLVERKLPELEVAHGDWWDPVASERAARTLLTPQAALTALLCCGDGPALVALRVARALGISVPEQLSVIGHGDYVMATYADPPLTTIVQPFQEMGCRAVECLLDKEAARERVLPTRLRVRQTTKNAPE